MAHSLLLLAVALAAGAATARATQLAVQKPAPAFTATAVVPDGKGDYEFKDVSLSDYAGEYVVLFFYPLDFTFVCPTEIVSFSDRAGEFAALPIRANVIGCSCDSKFSHLAWVNTPRDKGGLGNMAIPIISDYTKELAKTYNVLLDDGGDAGVSLRGTFIIDGAGILRHMSVNDLPVGRNVDEVLRLVEAFQHADAHGEVCPAGWKPGRKTMHGNAFSKKTAEFFSSGTLHTLAETNRN